MKTPIRLKVKSSSSCVTINSLFTDSTINELVNEIRKVIDLDFDNVELLNGYPPKPISTKSLTTTLSEVNIVSGDSIIVKVSPKNEIKKPRLDIDAPISINTKPESPKVKEENIIKEQSSMSILITKTIPSDNSCLFASVHYCLHNGSLSNFDSYSDRQMIAAVLLSDPERFNEAYLDNKKPIEYSNWIMNTNNWGGAIELCLLSKLNEIEIDVVNTQYNRVDRFGENEAYSHRILILYDGIHYDALAREYLSDGRIATRFAISDKEVLSQADQLAGEARSSRQYTDLHGFCVKCYECGKIICGQDEVAKHAKETSHSNFGEVNVG